MRYIKPEIEIGDSKQLDFYPQFKLKKWNNESNFSIRLNKPIEGSTNRKENNKTIWSSPKVDAEFYEINKDMGEDKEAYEFMVVLKEKPITNIVDFTLQSKECDFYYQGELTQEEIEEGAYRPEDVIGSYVIYHPLKRNNDYKTGKIGYISRPKIIDADGNEIWGILNIPKAKDKLTITIPQSFLDNAVYPIRVDPTVGFSSKGGTENSVNDAKCHAHADDDNTRVASTSEEVTLLTGWARIANAGSETFHLAVYSATGSAEPWATTTRLTNSETVTVDNTTAAEFTSSTLSVAMTSGTRYTAAWGEPSRTDDEILFYYDTTGAGRRDRQNNSGLGVNWSHTTYRTLALFSFYYTYGTVSAGVDKTFTVDALLEATKTKTCTADAILVNVKTTTLTADAFLAVVDNDKTFTADAILKATQDKTLTVDSILKKADNDKTFSLDAILTTTGSKTFTIDSILKKSDNDKTFDADAFLEKASDKTFTADAIIESAATKTFTVDSILKKSDNDKTLTADAILKKADNDKTFTSDSILTATGSKTFTVDSILKKADNDKTLTVDSILKQSNIDKTLTVDSILQKADNDKTFTADAILKQSNIDKTFTVDAVLDSGAIDKTFTVDAILKKSDNDKTFTVDAILQSSRKRWAPFGKKVKEYFLDISAPIIKENYEEREIFVPVQISRDTDLKIYLSIFKQKQMVFKVLSKVNSKKLFEILDAI